VNTVLALALALSSLFAETLVEGSVFEAGFKPVRGAVVQFDRADKPGRFSVKTNKVGHFGYSGMPGGRYSVTVLSPSKELLAERKDVIITGVPQQLDFTVSVQK
jgi:Carboxypeptidase regulatory-like domain